MILGYVLDVSTHTHTHTTHTTPQYTDTQGPTWWKTNYLCGLTINTYSFSFPARRTACYLAVSVRRVLSLVIAAVPVGHVIELGAARFLPSNETQVCVYVCVRVCVCVCVWSEV
jgi:hypothetical protein